MIKAGKKTKEWQNTLKKLIKIYQEKGITRCEYCHGNFALSFHHLEKRSSGLAKHTFADTRLLCVTCHELAEYNKDINEKIRLLRG